MISHGHTSKKRNGEKRISGEWTSWRAMIERCSDPEKRSHYGLPIHPLWMSFEHFLEDMGLKPSPAHTLDRIDGTKGYFPWNCRWATKEEQGCNRRDNIFKGHSVARVARELGIEKVHAFRKRLERGQSFDDLVPDESRPLIEKYKPNLPPPTREAVRNITA